MMTRHFFFIFSDNFFISTSDLETQTTCAPAVDNLSEITEPIPREDPVTNAILFFKLNIQAG